MRDFSNVETQMVFFDILVSWIEENPRDPLALARQWMEMSGAGSEVQQLARQLKKDFINGFANPKQAALDPSLTLMRAGLRCVRFREIVEHLINLSQPAEAKAEKDFDDLGYGDSDLV